MQRILTVGDITSPDALTFLTKNLWRIRREERIDFVIANAENASFLSGVSPRAAEELLDGGVDCITGGNHTMQNRAIFPMLESSRAILRPLNLPDLAPGSGYTILHAAGVRYLILCALGVVHMGPPNPDTPYPKIQRILEREAGNYDISILDIHAEATGEKLSLAYALDGRLSAVFGTHTHVQTADETILPSGTGYLSDVGMCGREGGVLGIDPAVMTERLRTGLNIPYAPAKGRLFANAAIFEIEEQTGKTRSLVRKTFFE